MEQGSAMKTVRKYLAYGTSLLATLALSTFLATGSYAKDVFTVDLTAPPSKFDPRKTLDKNSLYVNPSIFDTLVSITLASG